MQRARFASLEEALDRAEARARELADRGPREPLDLKYKRFEPIQQVAARIEIAGPQRLLATVDVNQIAGVRARQVRLRGEEPAVLRSG